jgi:hypothetical protein
LEVLPVSLGRVDVLPSDGEVGDELRAEDVAAAAASDDGDEQGLTAGSHGDGGEVGEWREKLEADLFRGSKAQAELPVARERGRSSRPHGQTYNTGDRLASSWKD